MTEVFSKGVFEDDWTREQTADGRTYFFNRATGASQWHVPNELYQSRCLDKSQEDTGADELVVMPSEARAVLGVDCLTEVMGSAQLVATRMAGQVLSKANTSATMVGEASMDPAEFAAKIDRPVIRMTIISAAGLRDTDFMPGKDKSDPYCVVEIDGKPNTRQSTGVISNCLDPEWNHQMLFDSYEWGDVFIFTVLDKDEYVALQDYGGSIHHNMEKDDLLGKSKLLLEDIESFDEVLTLELFESNGPNTSVMSDKTPTLDLKIDLEIRQEEVNPDLTQAGSN